jgi:hypothetical protein
MSELTTIEAKVAHLETEVKDAFHTALEAFRAELIRLGIEHEITPASAPVVVDPSPIATKGEHAASATPTGHKQK